MAFVWKSHKDIWKGEGVYHLTFAVAERRGLLGKLVALGESRSYTRCVKRNNVTDVNMGCSTQAPKLTSKMATTELSPFGFAVLEQLMAMPARYTRDSDSEPVMTICGKQFMPDHLHVVIWIKKDLGKSIRQIAQGFRIGVRKIAVNMGVWNNVDGHPLDVPFIRTLSHKGQLRAMIDYVHANPDNAWMRRLNPELYTIRRRQEHAGLLFDCMGKARLLEYPDRQVVALSRSLTKEQIEDEVQKALRNAERGVVTYTAAINEGEKAVAKAIREGKYPLVVMMMGGFPAEGSEAARYFHPSGVYHQACGEGRLYLMAPHEDNYQNVELMTRTEAELRLKAESKGLHYEPLPHSSTRWRMIAGNMMLEMIAGG